MNTYTFTFKDGGFISIEGDWVDLDGNCAWVYTGPKDSLSLSGVAYDFQSLAVTTQ